MDPFLFYTASHPSQWKDIILIHQQFKELDQDRWVKEPGEFPHPWKKAYSRETIWDEERFGNIWGAVQVEPLVHPILMPRIAELTNWEPEDLWSLVWWNASMKNGLLVQRGPLDDEPSGSLVIRELLKMAQPDPELVEMGLKPEDLLIDTLPVPPMRRRRSLVLEEGLTTPEGMYQYLHLLLQKLHQYREYQKVREGKDDIWVRRMGEAYLRRQQEWFEKILISCEEKPQTRWEIEQKWDLSSERGQRHSLFENDQPDVPDLITPDMVVDDTIPASPNLYARQSKVPLAIVTLDKAKIWVQYTDHGLIYDLELNKFGTPIATRGDLVGMTGNPKRLGYSYVEHICILDHEQGKWIGQYKGLEMAYMEELGPEKAYLVDLERQQAIRLEEVIDYPLPSVRSRNGKYIWVEDKEALGGIYEARSGWLIFSPGFYGSGEEPPFLTREGELQTLSPAAWSIVEETLEEAVAEYRELEIEQSFQHNALGRRNGDWWLFFTNALWINDQAIWRTDMAITAAAFGPDCNTLYLANSRELIQLTLDPEGKVSHQHRLNMQENLSK